jgi:hypothetical protein
VGDVMHTHTLDGGGLSGAEAVSAMTASAG